MRTTWLLVALAACGDDPVHHLDDAAPAADTAMPDGPRQTAGVSISRAGLARVGVHVIVTDLGGTYGGTFDTDATGLATAQIYPGGALTAVDPFGETGTNLYTIADVQPGDLIELAGKATSPTISVDVTLATYTGAADYAVYTSCGGGPVAGLSLTGCGSTTPLIAVARDANANPIATIWENHAPVAAALDLSAVPWVATASASYAFTNVPDGDGVFAFYDAIADEALVYSTGATGSSTAGAATIAFARPASLGTGHGLVDAGYHASHAGEDTIHHLLDTATSHDFATHLPDLTAPQVDNAYVFWTPIGGTAVPDVAFGAIHRTTDGLSRHYIAARLGLLDSDNSAVILPDVHGYDLTGSWEVDALATVQGDEKAVREYAFAGTYQYALVAAPVLEADYQLGVE